DHLTAAHVRSRPCLSGAGERALLLHVPQPLAAFDDQETIRLLDHHSDEADRRLQVVARERHHVLALWLDNSHRPHRLVAVLEPVIAFAAFGARGTFDDAPTLALLGFGDPALGGGQSWHQR